MQAVGSRRRKWLLHCSALLLAAAGLQAAPARAQGASAASGTNVSNTTKSALVLVVGDSLSAEYGIARGAGWVALLEQRLQREKLAATVINASISGDTTSGGRSRLPALLAQHKPAVVVLELGGNDALRGLPLAMTQTNLAEMARAAKATGARVVIVGMQMPPNYGRKYADDFFALFATVAKAQGAALVPFLLAGIGDSPDVEALFQADRIHPRAEAHPRMLENVWPVLRPLLK
jgi:acyl-CoA thioesterase I